MSIDFWAVSLSCFIVSIVLIAVSAVCRYFGKINRAYSESAEARVVQIATGPLASAENRTEFHDRMYPMIEFFAGGKLVKVKGPACRYPCPYYVGQRLHVSYERENPGNFQIVTDRRWQMGASVSHNAAVAFAVAGCFMFLMFAARVEI